VAAHVIVMINEIHLLIDSLILEYNDVTSLRDFTISIALGMALNSS